MCYVSRSDGHHRGHTRDWRLEVAHLILKYRTDVNAGHILDKILTVYEIVTRTLEPRTAAAAIRGIGVNVHVANNGAGLHSVSCPPSPRQYHQIAQALLEHGTEISRT